MNSFSCRRSPSNLLVLTLALAGATLVVGACADSSASAHDLADQVIFGQLQSESVELRPPSPPPEPVLRREPAAQGVLEPVAPTRAESATLVAHAVVDEVVAYAGPASTQEVARFSNPNRYGGPLVFQSLAAPDSDLIDSGWIPVLLPIRPNGTVGWIPISSVELTKNPYRIEVDVDDFELTVYRFGREHYSTAVGIGEGETPTPYGSFYLTDLLRPSNPNGIYGPYAYGLSGFSETLSSFNGGPGVIGIHGTNQPAAIGSRVSHGCIRIANNAITELSTFLPLGTPVVIGDDPRQSSG